MAGPGGQEVGRVSVRVVPDTDGFRRELKSALEKEIAGFKLEVPVDADFDSNGLKEKARAAAKDAGQSVKFDADGDLKKAISALNDDGKTKFKLEVDDQFDFRLRQRLAKIKAKVKVEPDVSAFDRIRGKIGDIFSGGGGGGGGIPLGAFADNLAVFAAVAAVAAPALALLSGVLVTLPAALAGALVPIGAIVLGLDGIKKAAEVLKDPLDSLKKAVSGTFQDRLTPIFDKLGQSMPQLTGPLKTVANGLSDVAQSFVDTITSGPGMEKIQSTISNIGTAISNAAPGVGTFTNGLLTLVDKVAAKFPGLSTGFNNIATSFGNWVTKITSPGIGGGLDGKTPLDTALTSLKDTVKEIMNLGGDLLGKGFDFLQDPKFGENMKTFVADIKDLITNVLPGLGSFFQDLAGAMHEVNTTIDKLPSWMKGDGEAPKPKGDSVFGDNAPFKQDDFWGASNLLGKGAKVDLGDGASIKDGLAGVWDSIKSAWDFITGDGLINEGGLFKDLGVGMASAAADTGTEAGTKLGQGLGQGFAGAQAQGGIQTQIQAIGPQVQQTLTAATTQIQQIPALIQQAFSGIGAAVTGSLATVVGSVVNAGSQIQAAFTAALTQLPAIAAGAFSSVQAAASAGMANVVVAITSGAAQAVAAVQTMGTQIVAALQSAAAGAQAAGAQVGAGMAAGIRANTGAAVAAAKDMAAQVSAAAKVELGVHSPSTVFHDIGVNTMEGMTNGLDEGSGSVIAKAQEVAKAISDAMESGTVGAELPDQLKRSMDELELVRKQLTVDKNAIPKDDKDGRAAVQSQLDQVKTIKDQLSLQKDQLGFSDKYGDGLDEHEKSLQQANNIVTEGIANIIDMGKGFAMANANQFMSDLGMSGNGAIPTIANIGLDWASGLLSKAISPAGAGGGTTINVNSIDEGLAAKQTIQNRKALQYKTR